MRSAYEISTCDCKPDLKMWAKVDETNRLISVRSVVQLYPGPLSHLVTPRAVQRSRGCHFSYPHGVRCSVGSRSGSRARRRGARTIGIDTTSPLGYESVRRCHAGRPWARRRADCVAESILLNGETIRRTEWRDRFEAVGRTSLNTSKEERRGGDKCSLTPFFIVPLVHYLA